MLKNDVKFKFLLCLLLTVIFTAACNSLLKTESHPVFDIKDFDSKPYTDTTDLFAFELEAAVKKNEGKDFLVYTLTVSPKSDRIFTDVTVTASLNEQWLDLLIEKNRESLFFGTDKTTAITINRNSQSNKGLVSGIGKYLEAGLSSDELSASLKTPVKVRLKYSDQTISLMVEPTKITTYGQDTGN